MNTITLTATSLPELGPPKRGKVRDIYPCKNGLLIVTTDRISVFDQIFNEGVADKGAVLTGISHFWLQETRDIIRNHLIDWPDPNVLFVEKCTPIKLEVIVRGHLVGSLWRDYQQGIRIKCGVALPDGLQQNDPLPSPIVTPTTKDEKLHDADITPQEIFETEKATPQQWEQMVAASLKLFSRGKKIAKERGLVLVDTKYEYGLTEKNELSLIDEIHTPDSSRYWYQNEGTAFVDKEIVRQWVMRQTGSPKAALPPLAEAIQQQLRTNYLRLYEAIVGQPLILDPQPINERIEENLTKKKYIESHYASLKE